MKTLIVTLSAACPVLAGYFGVRHLTHRDLGLTPTRKYVRNLAENLLHTELTAAREAGTFSQATSERTA